MRDSELARATQAALRGGAERYHHQNQERGKLFARERLARLLDEDSFVEDGLLANAQDGELPADGVITGIGRISGRTVALMANDSTVKAGSWGRRTVEKILRVQEQAARLNCPMLYLVDSAGARITDQVEMFPGRRGAGRMAEMVIGEKVTLEEMGGAKMHTAVSGCGDLLVKDEPEALALAQRYLT